MKMIHGVSEETSSLNRNGKNNLKTLKIRLNNSVYDISVARCVGTLKVYYCSFYMEYKNNKVKKVILDGKEYDPEELN